MTERRPKATAEQRAAIEDRDRDLFLSAAAGTGKTAVLVERFCEVVCATEGPDADASVESVLAFTFTERSADELKRRVRAELTRRAAAMAEPVRARQLRSLARDAESAWISTIHSFCQRVLGSNPTAAGLDPAFRVLDESEASRAADEAFDAAFQRFAAGEGDERFELAAAFRLTSLRDLVRGAYEELRATGFDRPMLPPIEPPDVDAAVGALHEAARAASATAAAAKRTSKVEQCLALLEEAVRATEGGARPDEDEVAAWRFSSKLLSGTEFDRYERARGTLERRLVEDRFAHHYAYIGELLTLYGEEYSHGKSRRSALDFEDLQVCARRLLRDRPDVAARYRRQFRHLMVDEFQDTNALQLDLIRLLRLEDGGPRNRLFTVGDELQSIYGFRHADVDVFREERAENERAPDSEAAVRRLTGNFRSSPAVLALVNGIGRALFGAAYVDLAVGEADVVGTGAPAAEVLVTERDGWNEAEGPAEVSADEHAQPWRMAEARFVAERLREICEEGVPRGDVVVLLRSFTYVEAYEQALADAGLAPHVVGGRGYWSKQQVADVRNLLGCVANPLDEKALFGALSSPACGASADALWLLREAAGGAPVWSAVRWLFGPSAEGGAEEEGGEREGAGGEPEEADERDGAAGAPRGAGGESDGAGDAPGWSQAAEEIGRHIPPEDAERLREFTGALLELRRAAPGLSLEALIDRTVAATGYDLALLMRPPGRRRMANVRKLMRLAREFEADEGRDLRGFLDFVAAETEVDGREAEAALDAEGHDGVRLMTVHTAKGLEFPVVAVADLGRSLGAGRGPLLRMEPAAGTASAGEGEAMRVGLRLARLGRKSIPILDYPELEERAVEREREEERRILHVAMTRAEQRLILSGAMKLDKLADEPKATDPLIASVLRALAWSPERASVALDAPSGVADGAAPIEVEVRTRLPAGERMTSRPLAAPSAPAESELAPLSDPDLAPLADGGAPPVRAISYSALSLYERCGYRFYAERVLGLRPRLPRAVARGASNGSQAPATDEIGPAGDDAASRYGRGRAVHELLERSARSGWAVPAEREVARLLRREGLGADESLVERTIGLVEGFLDAPMRAELAGARSIQPEAPFAFRAGGLIVRGEIDLLADLGEEMLVVDYKSDTLEGSEPGDHMARYEVQRWIYALAALRRYGRPVRVAYVFLERPEAPVEHRFEPDHAAALAAEVEGLAGAVARGRFEVTETPERALCLDCPARERLCVHPPELTLRERAPA
jgi:ATP-dependent exoDNAse (exonuclease V) beta subunit